MGEVEVTTLIFVVSGVSGLVTAVCTGLLLRRNEAARVHTSWPSLDAELAVLAEEAAIKRARRLL